MDNYLPRGDNYSDTNWVYSTHRLNRRKTTQIMTNISAMPARMPIIAGSTYLSGSRDSFVTVDMLFKMNGNIFFLLYSNKVHLNLLEIRYPRQMIAIVDDCVHHQRLFNYVTLKLTWNHNRLLPLHSMVPSLFMIGSISKRQMHLPSRHSVWKLNASHCSLKKQLSLIDASAMFNGWKNMQTCYKKIEHKKKLLNSWMKAHLCQACSSLMIFNFCLALHNLQLKACID